MQLSCVTAAVLSQVINSGEGWWIVLSNQLYGL
jgi:hypothetical protein